MGVVIFGACGSIGSTGSVDTERLAGIEHKYGTRCKEHMQLAGGRDCASARARLVIALGRGLSRCNRHDRQAPHLPYDQCGRYIRVEHVPVKSAQSAHLLRLTVVKLAQHVRPIGDRGANDAVDMRVVTNGRVGGTVSLGKATRPENAARSAALSSVLLAESWKPPRQPAAVAPSSRQENPNPTNIVTVHGRLRVRLKGGRIVASEDVRSLAVFQARDGSGNG